MMWDNVVQAAVALLLADPALTSALGTDADGIVPIYPAGASRPVLIPSVEYFIVLDRYEESLNPILVQWDYWARGMQQATTIERRLRSVLHSETRRQFAGVDCATLYDDSRDHRHPEPGVIHRSVDIRFEPVRERYVVSGS